MEVFCKLHSKDICKQGKFVYEGILAWQSTISCASACVYMWYVRSIVLHTTTKYQSACYCAAVILSDAIELIS